MFRAAQQKELVDRVQENSAMHKLEQRLSKERRAVLEAERLENLAAERELARAARAEKRSMALARMQARHNAIREDSQNSAAVAKHKRLAMISSGVLRPRRTAKIQEVQL